MWKIKSISAIKPGGGKVLICVCFHPHYLGTVFSLSWPKNSGVKCENVRQLKLGPTEQRSKTQQLLYNRTAQKAFQNFTLHTRCVLGPCRNFSVFFLPPSPLSVFLSEQFWVAVPFLWPRGAVPLLPVFPAGQDQLQWCSGCYWGETQATQDRL